MKKNYFFHVVKYYYKNKMKNAVKFFAFIIIFFSVYSLYHLPLEPISYSVILIVTLELIFSIFGFVKYYKKHILLQHIFIEGEFYSNKLPIAKSLIEEDYQNIIEHIYKEKISMISKSATKYTDMEEYYTMWVHQIKTPISAFSMIIQSMKPSEEKKLMEQELFKIEQYVEMAMHYIRLENLSSDLKLEKYSLKNILNQVIKKYSITFIYKKITLNLKEIKCDVITDEKWIVFVLEQILSNALKYTVNGSISIHMDETLEKTLVIEDTGIGIASEDISRVFEKGFTGYNGRKDKKSTGIGLYLCKEITKRLSHNIYITSKIGKGTKVFIDFSTEKIDIC